MVETSDDVQRGSITIAVPNGKFFCFPCSEKTRLSLEACRAALLYDAAIQRHAAKDKSWVGADDLDALYSDWIDKARSAIEKAGAQ
jgi:hypothetical protein